MRPGELSGKFDEKGLGRRPSLPQVRGRMSRNGDPLLRIDGACKRSRMLGRWWGLLTMRFVDAVIPPGDRAARLQRKAQKGLRLIERR